MILAAPPVPAGREPSRRLGGLLMLRCLWTLPVMGLLGLTGCLDPQTRLQSAEETERDKDLDVRTIGEVTEIGNFGGLRVSGVGLVVGLNGTGGTPPGGQRVMLEQELRKKKVEHIKEILDSPDNALVIVQAYIPPGGRRGEGVDVEITLPPGSPATSLAGGYLMACPLRNYDSTRNLGEQVNKEYQGGDRTLSGHILAHAKGQLLVGLGNPEEANEVKRARIWEGAVSLADRPIYLVLKNDEKSARIAGAVADKINLMFQDDVRRQQWIKENTKWIYVNDIQEQINVRQEAPPPGRKQTAKVVSKEVVDIHIPWAYRLNPDRYLRVVRNVPLREAPDQQARYRLRLEKMLLDPGDSVRAAVRLEALGKESMPTLKKGLASQHPLVRFSSAEALAYLGSTAGADELAKLAEQHTLLRLACLTALASLDEGLCRDHLGRLLTVPAPEVRCGAFRALCLADERDPRLNGQRQKGGYTLHRVATGADPLVYFSMSKRAEVVLFGKDVSLTTPVKLRAGKEFIITAEVGDDRVTVARIPDVGRDERKQCTLQMADVLRTLDELGAAYPEVVEFLRKVEERRCSTAPVCFNAMPPLVEIEELAAASRNDPNFLRDDR